MTLVKRKNNEWLPSVFDDILQTDWLSENAKASNNGRNVPAVNIRDNEDNFTVELAAPGKQKEDFNIELDNDVLTIFSEDKQETSSEEKGKFTRKEFNYSSFNRSFTLPETVDSNKIGANYENGILKINIPKREDAKPAPKRLIEIS